MQEAHFTVSLCDYPELPEDKRQQAEARYARVLARQLGGEEQVGEALSLVQGIVNDHSGVLSVTASELGGCLVLLEFPLTLDDRRSS